MHLFKKISPHLFVSLGLLLATSLAKADSYSITVPPTGGISTNGKFFAAHHFTNNTVANALSTVPHGTTLSVWNNGNQTYDTITFVSTAWSNPNYVLTPGAVFFIQNPSADNPLTVTISGTDPSNSITNVLTASAWNGYGFISKPIEYLNQGTYWDFAPGDASGALELPCPGGGQTSRHYPGVNGDTYYVWDQEDQVWRTSTRLHPDGTAPEYAQWEHGYCDPGYIPRGYGAFFYIAGSTRNWVQPVTAN